MPKKRIQPNVIERYEPLKKYGALLEAHPWRFAKTMPRNPHWYTMRHEWEDQSAFDEVVLAIREYGRSAKYGKYYYRELEINGFYYWAMGGAKTTILINRAKINKNQPFPYDLIADQYDGFFVNEQYSAENRQVARHVELKGNVLDIGCGTGLLVENFEIQPQHYTGIDPAEKMLERFAAKHPEYAERLQLSTFENYTAEGFDTVVALFGSFNYVEPAAIELIPRKLRKGGTYHLMFMAEEYEPETHRLAKVKIPFHRLSEFTMLKNAKFTRFGNFEIVSGVLE